MGFIRNQVDKMLEPRHSNWASVSHEPYVLNEEIERSFDAIVIQPIRVRGRMHMVRPRDIQDATIRLQERGLQMQRPLFDTSETEIDDCDLYERPPPRCSSDVETAMLHRDQDKEDGGVSITRPLHTNDDPGAECGLQKRSRPIIIKDDEDEDAEDEYEE